MCTDAADAGSVGVDALSLELNHVCGRMIDILVRVHF